MKSIAALLGLLTTIGTFAAEPAPVLQPIKPQAQAAPAPPVSPSRNPYLQSQQGGWIVPMQTPYGPIITQQASMPLYRDYQMNRVISPEEKKRYLQMAMPMMANMMQLDAREAMNYMVVKYKAKPGLTFDEVVESLKLRGNQLNFKLVGENLMWKDFKAVLNDNTAPRVEVFSFCDIAVGRQLLKLIPEMAAFLPCRITVMEDADKNIWVLTQDWDATWLDYAGKAMGITPELRKASIEIRDKMDNMMRAAANGDI
jgi:uncharacterized protein (DUF302 family)